MPRIPMGVIRTQQFKSVWGSLSIAEKCIWLYFLSTNMAVITILEVFLIK